MELGENRRYYRHRHRSALHHLRPTLARNRFSNALTLLKGMRFQELFSGGFVSGGAVCVI